MEVAPRYSLLTLLTWFTLSKWFTLLTWLTLFRLFIQLKLLYTAKTLAIGTIALLGWTDELLSKTCYWSGWVSGYPLDCYDYQSTCGATNKNI